MSHSTITVFGSASAKEGEPLYQIAFDLGKTLAEGGFIVCNGGYGGTMEATARGAKEAGGRTIGVISSVSMGGSANRWIDEIIETKSLVDRLLRLISEGDGYVVLQGGTGTLFELAAVWEMLSKRLIGRKPVVTLGGHWDDVVGIVDRELRREKKHGAGLISLAKTPKECFDILIDTLGVRYEA
jgi:uncharacterized protein (TIGR00725 family)